MELKTNPRMTIEQLRKTAQFHCLTPKLRMWVSTFLQSWIDLGIPDLRLSTQSAFATEGENARTLGYKVLRNPKIQACLRVIKQHGKTKRQIFLDGLEAEIASSKPGTVARSRLLETYASVAFRRKRKKRG